MEQNEFCENVKLSTYESITEYVKKCASGNPDEQQKMVDIINEMRLKSENDLKLPNGFLISLLTIYGIMIAFGSVGSFMVILIVAKNQIMRTPRNLFILNLAISDLILCSFTEPFNLYRLLSSHREWNLGDTICRLTSMLQATNILVSTFSITAIALDRFHVIVHPEKPPLSTKGVIKILLLIWLLAIVLSCPLYFFSGVYQGEPKRCFEHADNVVLKRLRLAHSYLMLVLQYVVPMVIVSFTYFRICVRIKYRMVNQRAKTINLNMSVPSSQVAEQKRISDLRRQKRTNILLTCLAVIFALSWLPLNTVNMVMDLKQHSFSERKGVDSNVTDMITSPSSNIQQRNASTTMEPTESGNQSINALLIQGICLLIVLCSACANPVLYGWLNENFKREFRFMFKSITSICWKVPIVSRRAAEDLTLVVKHVDENCEPSENVRLNDYCEPNTQPVKDDDCLQ